jgi:hypothetical protein
MRWVRDRRQSTRILSEYRDVITSVEGVLREEVGKKNYQ